MSSLQRKGILAVLTPGAVAKATRKRTREERELEKDEDSVETYLVKQVEGVGGECHKLKGHTGWPDRTCLWPGPNCDFIECKRPKGGRFEPLQLRTHARLRKKGFVVLVLNTKAKVDEYVNWRMGAGGLSRELFDRSHK